VEQNMSQIVVGVDGSESSRPALYWAVQQAQALALPVKVVAVRPPDAHDATGHESELAEHTRALLGKVLADAGVTAGEGSLDVTVLTRTGNPAQVLVAEAQDAAHLVLGPHGTDAFCRFALEAGGPGRQGIYCPVTIFPARHHDI
jgi:nucleotide-binding universal stress UspA family protein